jgi:hypothetical protein
MHMQFYCGDYLSLLPARAETQPSNPNIEATGTAELALSHAKVTVAALLLLLPGRRLLLSSAAATTFCIQQPQYMFACWWLKVASMCVVLFS